MPEHHHRVELLADLAGAEVGARSPSRRRRRSAARWRSAPPRAPPPAPTAEPVKDCAPNCLIRPPTCSAMTAPNGIATSAVGTIVTEAMNHACWMNSRSWNGRRNSACATSTRARRRTSLPAVADGREHAGDDGEAIGTSGSRRHGQCSSSNEPGGGVTPLLAAPLARLALAAPRDAVGRLAAAAGSGGSGGSSWPFSAASSSASFSSDMPIGPTRWALRNWRTTGSSERQQHLAGPEHRQVLVVEQPDVVRAPCGRC